MYEERLCQDIAGDLFSSVKYFLTGRTGIFQPLNMSLHMLLDMAKQAVISTHPAEKQSINILYELVDLNLRLGHVR